MAPFGKVSSAVLRESEVDGAREELLGAVDAPRGQQFLRADQPEQIALFGTDQVLAAFAAGQRKIARAHVPAARVIGQNRGILIVGMRGDHQHAAQYVQLFERLLDGGRAGKRRLRDMRA